MPVSQLPTPALVVDLDDLNHNIDVMSTARPGPALRPHIKAHKSTALARHVAQRGGHDRFCCATLREMEGMVAAAVGTDLLLANETLDGDRLGRLARAGADAGILITTAIDSDATLDVAVRAAQIAPLAVLIDVNVGLPRCGCLPSDAGRLADAARSAGLEVRGVMGYEGHVVGNPDREWRRTQVAECMAQLWLAHDAVGGDITSAGGTGTYDLHDWANEVQAGSYLLMDTHYGQLGLPFRQALRCLATVVSVHPTDGYAVADAGLKAFGMDHGEPTIVGHTMFFSSDEHATFVPDPEHPVRVGDRVELLPAHVDPTMALHERIHVAVGDEIVDTWDIDLRNW